MLLINATICFDKNKLKNDLDAKKPIRPAFDFGNGMLFSGALKPEENIKSIELGKKYKMDIEFLTMNDEGYELVKDVLVKGGKIKMNTGAKIIGYGTIHEFNYN